MESSGSPPHGRGKGGSSGGCLCLGRITPAWAGKSSRHCRWRSETRDHPRMGGEKLRHKGQIDPGVGSPPHGRGKEQGAGGRMAAHGITPAWAGKSGTIATVKKPRRDHPRVGGEKLYRQFQFFALKGSPPRGRGKVVEICDVVALVGITPALAGKSLASQPWSPPLWMMVIRPRP